MDKPKGVQVQVLSRAQVNSMFAILQAMSLIIAFIAALVGILISSYIFIKKYRHQALACPRDNPCDTVLHSKFSKTLGVPNEILGLGYFIFVGIIIFSIANGVATPWVLYVLFFLLVLGGLFSFYLLGLQAFVIRSWCAWCLGITGANIVMIVSLLGIPTETFSPLLESQRILWVIIHNIGFILGVGAATITDIFFFRFLKDNTISAEEKETMDTLSSVIWIGLGVLIVSGLALYIPESARLDVSSKFLLKVVVVGVIAVNGFLLNMFVGPYMRRLSFEGTKPARRFRRLAFALGGISMVSWYTAFFLGSLRKINIVFSEAILGYGALIVCVIVGSQIAERYITRQHLAVPKDEL